MKRGKVTCMILKELRRRIAEANDIKLTIEECRYQGDCRGTCPRCESEVAYLESQLSQRRRLGRAVILTGLSAGITGLASCSGAVSNRAAEEIALAEFKIVADSILSTEEDKTQEHSSSDTQQVDDKDGTDEKIIALGSSDEEIDNIIKARAEEQESIKIINIVGEFNIHEEPIDPESIDLDTYVFDAVEQMPAFPGGESALLTFIKNNLRYPPSAWENGIQGTVLLQFVVNRNGSIGEVKIVRSKDPDLDSEAVRIVKGMPKFTPGRHNGRDVNVWFTLPIRFKLSEHPSPYTEEQRAAD